MATNPAAMELTVTTSRVHHRLQHVPRGDHGVPERLHSVRDLGQVNSIQVGVHVRQETLHVERREDGLPDATTEPLDVLREVLPLAEHGLQVGPFHHTEEPPALIRHQVERLRHVVERHLAHADQLGDGGLGNTDGLRQVLQDRNAGVGELPEFLSHEAAGGADLTEGKNQPVHVRPGGDGHVTEPGQDRNDVMHLEPERHRLLTGLDELLGGERSADGQVHDVAEDLLTPLCGPGHDLERNPHALEFHRQPHGRPQHFLNEEGAEGDQPGLNHVEYPQVLSGVSPHPHYDPFDVHVLSSSSRRLVRTGQLRGGPAAVGRPAWQPLEEPQEARPPAS
jgi:hypothetical protein